MAEEQQNKNSKGIGELFVEFGTTGLGQFLKGLNGVKAQFLLSKAAAEQFTKPLINMSKNAAGGITALSKLNAVTGLSIKQLQELKVWTKLNNVEFGDFMGQVQSLQQNLLDIAMGRGNVKGYALLGLNPKDMDYRNPLEALGKIRERILQLDEATGLLAIREIGLSENVYYAMKQQNNAFDERLLLNKQEAESLSEQQAAWNSLGATWQAVQDKFIAKQGWIINLLNKTRQAIEFVGKATKEDWYDAINTAVPKAAQAAKEDISKPKESKILQSGIPLGIKMGWELGKSLADYGIYTFGGGNKKENTTELRPITSQPMELESIPNSELGADNFINENLPPMPSVATAGNNITNVQIAVTNNISGQDAAEISSRTNEKFQDTIAMVSNQNNWSV